MGDSKNISTSPQPEEPPKELTKKEIWLEQYKKDQLFVGSFLSYIMQTKQVVAITPFGNYEITLKFQDGTSMNVWVANKYYAFAMCGEYFGKTNRIKWNRVWLISEDSAKLFEQWFTNSFNNYKRFELDSVDIEGKFKSDEEEIPESSKYIQK